jgi:hypothetical protein
MRCSTNFQDINSQKQALQDYCNKNNYKYKEYPPHKYLFYDGLNKKKVLLNTAILEIYIIRKLS